MRRKLCSGLTLACLCLSIAATAQTFDTVQFMVPSGGGLGVFLTGYDLWSTIGTCWGGEPGCPAKQPASKTYQTGNVITHLKWYWTSLPVEEYTIGLEYIYVYREGMDWSTNSNYRYYGDTKWLPRYITYLQPSTFDNPALTCFSTCSVPCAPSDTHDPTTTTVEIFESSWGLLNGGNPIWVLKRHNHNTANNWVEDYYYGLGYGFIEYELYDSGGAFVQGTYRLKQEFDWGQTTAPACAD